MVRSLTRVGDGVQLAILELTEQRVVPQKEKKAKETKEKKVPPPPKEAKAKPEPKSQKEVPPAETPKTEKPKEKKPSGFLGNLRRFLKPKDRASS